MLRSTSHRDGGGAAIVYNSAHGLGITPDWAHVQSRTSTPGWRATLGNDGAGLRAYDNVNVHVMVHSANAVHYTATAVVWQGRSY